MKLEENAIQLDADKIECQCGECRSFQTVKILCCCRELPFLNEKREGVRCITLHPWFIANCLNKDVLYDGSKHLEFPFDEINMERASTLFCDWIQTDELSFKNGNVPACFFVAFMKTWLMHSRTANECTVMQMCLH
ncbi:uncharacterized protein LOC128221366 [Mya arenaria]|uniref:uncharacterized protein LOC128221366 n=1 Tax=Mya arenaria TaxID=6604 RepID=UPI0022E3C3FB|nr:uncharacterized protein LOC128221366 [Mya arenaria]